MSIPPTAPGRGAAAFLPQPVSHTDQLAAQSLVETVYYYNAREIRPPVADVEYRSSDRESDILHHVFRWDVAPYQFVFENGFEARRQANTPDITYFNLERYIHAGGRPLDTRRDTTYAFVSTTLSSSWNPQIKSGTSMELYRYEIYAPGGIWVAETLEDQYRFKSQDEVTFIAGIAPQYIRSAQLFQLRAEGPHTKKKRVNTILYVNKNFNPQSSPPRNLRILRPVSDYIDDTTKERKKLSIQKFPAVKSLNNSITNNIDYYIDEVTKIDGYIDSCFRSVRTNEVYLFMEKEFVLMDYAPDTKKDRVINGPLFISNGFGSLIGTAFANYGIDAAFGCHGVSEAFIFSANVCAKFNYSPGNTNDRIVEGPKTIKQMFPFFKGTNFAQGIDAGFESSRTGEAYLFKGGEYALINYAKRAMLAKGKITDAFSCLRETMFASGVGAAFASHKPNEAYLFKDNTYVLIYFTPGEKKDRIIAGPKELVPSTWPSLRGILPHKNRGVDVIENAKPDPPRDQDD